MVYGMYLAYGMAFDMIYRKLYGIIYVMIWYAVWYGNIWLLSYGVWRDIWGGIK